jgi:transcriptional regulator with XRE-family HTH domain
MLRTGRGLSQEALADRIGIDRTYISMLERERSAATLDMLEKLASAFGIEPWELLLPER